MEKRRVAVTGMGLVSAAGQSLDRFWERLVTGKSGIKSIERFDASGFTTRIAAEINDFEPGDYMPKKESRRMDRFVQFACAAALMAAEDAGLQLEPGEAGRVGVWIGTGVGGIETLEKQYLAMQSRGPGAINPFFIPMMIPNMASGQVSILLGAKGPCGTTVTACASGTNSVGEAFRCIQHWDADVMICGGSEASITPLAIGGFCAARAMSTENDYPEAACRPFDLHRDGFVMGEGAGVLILEEMSRARERGAKIYGEIVGYGMSSDAYHVVQPEAEGGGAAMAFSRALADAGIRPEQMDYINAHGTGTPLNDAMETRAIKKVFGNHAYSLNVSSIKPATGHMLGAAGAVELIATLLAMKNQTVPLTIGLLESDPECDLNYTPLESRKRRIDVAMSDSLGFGGHNAALIVRRCQ